MVPAAVPMAVPVNHVPAVAVPVMVAMAVTAMSVVHDDDPMHHPSSSHQNMAASRAVPVASNDDPPIVIPTVIAMIVANVALFDADVSDLLVAVVGVRPSIVDPDVAAPGTVGVALGVVPSAVPIIVPAVIVVAAFHANRFGIAGVPPGVNDASRKNEKSQRSGFHQSLRQVQRTDQRSSSRQSRSIHTGPVTPIRGV